MSYDFPADPEGRKKGQEGIRSLQSLPDSVLTPRQVLFVDELFKDPKRVARHAAERAGYKVKTNPKISNELMKLPRIKAEIERREFQLRESTKITQEKVAQRLAALAFADPRLYFNEDGTLKKVSELGDNEAFALQSMEISTEMGADGDEASVVLAKLRRWDPNKALDSLAKLLGLNAPDKVDIQAQTQSVVHIVPWGDYIPLASDESSIVDSDGLIGYEGVSKRREEDAT